MTINELIKELQKIEKDFGGNVEVMGFDSEDGLYSNPEVKLNAFPPIAGSDEPIPFISIR